MMWDDRKWVYENGEFWLTFVLSFFVLFALRPDHTVGPITTNEGSKRVLCISLDIYIWLLRTD